MRKICRSDLYYISILLLIFVGAMNKYLAYFSIISTFLISLGIALDSSNSIIKCKWIISLICFQNLMIGLGAHLVGNQDSSLKLLTQVPFLSIFTVWFIRCFIRNIKVITKGRLLFFLLLLTIGVSYVIGHGNIQAILITMRNLTVFYMAYEIGESYLHDAIAYKELSKFIIEMGIFLTLIGVVILFCGYPLYKSIGIHEVYIAKAAPFVIGGLDGRFYTSFFSGKSFVRMGSLFYEPVNIAYFMSLSFILSLYCNPWKSSKAKIAAILITGLGLLLSGGKGGWIIAAAVIACVGGKSLLLKFKGNIKSVSSWIMVIVTVLIIYIFVKLYISRDGMAVMNHIWGIINTGKAIIARPLGYGLGTGGNAAQVFSESPDSSTWLSSGGETAFFSFAYQLGIPGVIIFILNFLNTSSKRLESTDRILIMSFFIPFILLGVSIMQDNTFTVQCIVPFMLLQGSAKNMENAR